MNDRIDEHLRTVLARREPPAGFAGRVMARIPAPASRPSRPWLSHRWMAALAAALILMMFAGTWRVQRERQRRLEAEQAKVELIYALELTSAKLQQTRSRLVRIAGGSI